jgi:hypothetical protein
MDPLSDLLRVVRLDGAFFYIELVAGDVIVFPHGDADLLSSPGHHVPVLSSPTRRSSGR